MISIFANGPNVTIRLYLDGIFTSSAFETLVLLKDQHKLQAIQVEDSSLGDVQFLASSSNGIRTDKWWRCTNVYDEGWFLPNYSDTSWPTVFVLDDNSYAPFIAEEAKVIGYEVESNNIYCRRNLTMGKEISPCRARDRLTSKLTKYVERNSLKISLPSQVRIKKE